MATQDEDVIRTWLETNYAEALKKGDDAVVEFRAQVAAMGPEVVAVLQGIEGTTATVSASVGESLATMSVKLEEATGQGEGESGQGGFKGMASGVMKAEKAIHSLASGSGLGRLGSMLEGVLGPMGVPGLGMALGALAYELEPLIPKIRQFVDAWEMGVKPLSDTAEAIERLNRAQGESRQKRALGRIEGKITALEDEEDTQGWLAPDKQAQLRKLREAAWLKRQEFAQEQAAEDAAKQKAIKRKETDEAVKFAGDWAGELDAQQRKEAHQQLEARRKRVEHAQRVEDEGIIEQANEQDRAERDAGRQAERQKKDADRAQAQARRDAARTARENTPEAVNRSRAAEDANIVMAEEQRQNEYRQQQGAMPFEAGELEQVKHKVMMAMPEARARGMDLAQLVNWAMAMQANEIEEGVARGMGQQNRSGMNLGSRY